MTRDERERLGDIAGPIETIRTHAVDTSAGERIKRDAILYNLVILGEAVKGLGEEIRAQEPEIPWRQIAGLRDLLSHEYYRIDMAAINSIIEHDLGPLGAAVSKLQGPKRRPTN